MAAGASCLTENRKTAPPLPDPLTCINPLRILFLTQIVPYPPDAGPKVKTWHVLRALADFGHEITLATFVREEEKQNLAALSEICHEVFPVQIQRSRAADVKYWLKSHLTQRPFLVERDDLPAMRTLLADLISKHRYDAIHADQLTMAQFAVAPRSTSANGKHTDQWPMTVFDAHNAVWTIMERMSENSRAYIKPVLSLEKNRIKKFEGEMVCRFNHTLAVIQPDKEALLQAAGLYRRSVSPSIDVIPIAVDTEELAPVKLQLDSMNIMTLGTLHYPPNADGIRWFLNDVFPLVQKKIKGTSLTIIGKNPPEDFLQAAQYSNGAIEVTGFVPELAPYYERAGVVVIPVRAGGGMRVRILESFSRGVPVVTTTVGLEGIEAEHNREVLVADTPNEFAEAVCRLLTDRAERTRLGAAGRELVVQRYDWKVVLKALQSLYPLG